MHLLQGISCVPPGLGKDYSFCILHFRLAFLVLWFCILDSSLHSSLTDYHFWSLIQLSWLYSSFLVPYSWFSTWFSWFLILHHYWFNSDLDSWFGFLIPDSWSWIFIDLSCFLISDSDLNIQVVIWDSSSGIELYMTHSGSGRFTIYKICFGAWNLVLDHDHYQDWEIYINHCSSIIHYPIDRDFFWRWFAVNRPRIVIRCGCCYYQRFSKMTTCIQLLFRHSSSIVLSRTLRDCLRSTDYDRLQLGLLPLRCLVTLAELISATTRLREEGEL